MAADNAALLKTILWAVVGLVGYFLPILIASARRHRNTEAIGLINLLAGWTAIGWIIAMIWACLPNMKAEPNRNLRT